MATAKKNGHKPNHPNHPTHPAKPAHQQPGCHCVHLDNQFEAIVDLLQESKREMTEGLCAVKESLADVKETLEETNEKLDELEDKMAQTLQDVKDALEEVVTSLDGLKTSVDALIAQGGSGGETDTTEIVTAIGTINDGLTALKTAVDAALGGGTSGPEDFDSTKAYVVGDKVKATDGQTYVAIQDSTGEEPSVSTDFWTLA